MSSLTKFERYQRFMPNLYRVGNNRIITGLLKACAESDEEIVVNLQETKNQLFIRFASGKYLDWLGSNRGLSRPKAVHVGDEQYRDYLIAGGFKPKNVRKLIYEMLEIFWGKHSTNSNVTSTVYEPFNFSGVPLYLLINIDNNETKTIKFEFDDFDDVFNATCQEIADKVNYVYGDKVFAEAFFDATTDETYLRLYTNTPGISGSIQVAGGSANTILAFETTKMQSVTATVLEIYPKHLILKLPANAPLVTDLKYAHYFHPDETLDDNIPADSLNPYWPGSFVFDPESTYTLPNIHCFTTEQIDKGSIITTLEVDDCSSFPNEHGKIIMNYGTSSMEEVKYTARLSNTTLAIDPTHVFQHDFIIGARATLTIATNEYPRNFGEDYPIYFIETEIARPLMLEIIDIIKAAGVLLEFDITETEYLYQGQGTAEWYNVIAATTGKEAWFQPPKMTTLEANVMIAAWGVAEQGRIWYDTSTNQLMMWDGSGTVIVA